MSAKSPTYALMPIARPLTAISAGPSFQFATTVAPLAGVSDIR
jgi:hypothetical protein